MPALFSLLFLSQGLNNPSGKRIPFAAVSLLALARCASASWKPSRSYGWT